MTDLTTSIAAKSDQLNADDLIGGPVTVTINDVRGVSGDQPILVDLADRKPYYPCKSMRRVMVALWGAKGDQYVGRSMTLYRDATVTYGGMAVGGIRISHMSHIDKPHTVVIAASSKTKTPFTIQPLVVEAPAVEYIALTWPEWIKSAGVTGDQLKAFLQSQGRTSATMSDDELSEILGAPIKYGTAIRKWADDQSSRVTA